ncbi:MAG: ABC transporter substrate-binding protein [bacterium]|nr:ABC transporter substrate-binding protein [bacterium]
MLLATVAVARAGEDPKAVVQANADRIIAVLSNEALSQEQKRQQVEDIVVSGVDFEILSRLVLARNWSRFSPAQQDEFMREFRRHLSQTYGRRLDQYRNEKIQVTSERTESNGDVTVKSRILRGGAGADVDLDYRLRKVDGQWKIIDFVIEQVSLVSNFRSQFQDIVASGGPERLLTVLREKTAKGEEFKAS